MPQSSGDVNSSISSFHRLGLEQYRKKAFDQAHDLFLRGAKGGESECSRMLGMMTLKGQGIPQDKGKAVEWFLKAGNTNANAVYNLGELYYYGDGVEKDQDRAMDLFRRAANLGFAPAYYRLGHYCLQLKPPSAVEASKWFKKAADAGLGEGKYMLTQVLAFAAPKAKDEWLKWMREAAAAGVPMAETDLAVAYINGDKVPADLNRGIELLKKAAAKDFPPAQFNLAMFYSNGRGVRKDEVEAYKLLVLAGAAGNAQAATTRAKLDLEILIDTIVKGIERARLYLKANPPSEYSSDPQLCHDFETWE